ncbi:MAG TPA: hypothetical protein VL094_06660 [Sphingomonadaceae bacterium]|nr:hypothetical protein [Sphingomonadaceae bacterium]
MDITFSKAEIRDLCCCRSRLIKQFGTDLGKKICSRLSLLAAVSNLSDIPSAPPISLTAVDGVDMYSVALGVELRLLFKVVVPHRASAKPNPVVQQIEIIGPEPVPAAKGRRT